MENKIILIIVEVVVIVMEISKITMIIQRVRESMRSSSITNWMWRTSRQSKLIMILKP